MRLEFQIFLPVYRAAIRNWFSDNRRTRHTGQIVPVIKIQTQAPVGFRVLWCRSHDSVWKFDCLV